MTTLSNHRRHCTTGLLVAAIAVLMALLSPGTTSAQYNCLCQGDKNYFLTVGAWPASLGSFTVKVGVINQGTAARTTYTHSGLNSGSTVTQQFSTSFPSQSFSLDDIEIVFCSGTQTFIGIACDSYYEPNPLTYCYQITCNGLHYCLKVQYKKGPGTNPCWYIVIEAQQVFSSPWNCSPSFCTPSL